MVAWALSFEIYWLDSEAKHSPPSSSEVVNWWSYESTQGYAFMQYYETNLTRRNDATWSEL